MGISAWKLADDSHYIYHFIHEYRIKPFVEKGKGKPLLNNLILKNMLDHVFPPGVSSEDNQYTFSIDAGMLGNVENAETLSNNHQYFIISVPRKNSFDVFTPILLDEDYLKAEYINLNKKRPSATTYENLTTMEKDQLKEKLILKRKSKKDDLEYVQTIKYGSNDKYTAIAWRARDKKVCYFLTNIPQPVICYDKEANETQ
eukprot:gene15408-18275_t